MFSQVSIFVVFISITSISTAPTSNISIKNLFDSDKRLKTLKEERFVNGFCLKNPKLDNFSSSLCLALYDIGLTFDKRSEPFKTPQEYDPIGFCSKLEQVITDKPLNEETTEINNGSLWLKDVLNTPQGSSKCEEKCVFEDQNDYVTKTSKICRFLLEQFSALKQQSRDDAEKPKESSNNKSDDAKPAANVVASQPLIKIQPANSLETVKKEIPAPESDLPLDSTLRANKSNSTVEEVKSQVVDESNQTKSNTSSVAVDTKATTIQKVNKTIPSQPNGNNGVKEVDITEDETSKKTQENETVEQNNADGEHDVFDEISPSEGALGDDDKDQYQEDEDGLTGDNNRNMAQKLPLDNHVGEAESSQFDKESPKVVEDPFQQDPDSNFFVYLCGAMFLCVFLYVLQQNRNKLLALCLEGRRGSRRNRERSRGGSKAVYSKLDCNLEEAIMSNKSMKEKSMDIIY